MPTPHDPDALDGRDTEALVRPPEPDEPASPPPGPPGDGIGDDGESPFEINAGPPEGAQGEL